MKRPFTAYKRAAQAETSWRGWPQCQHKRARTLQSATHFSFMTNQESKKPPLGTRRQLHNVLCCPHFTIRAPFIPNSWRGTADSLSSAPRPLCLISVIQLMRPGLWQAAGTYTKGGSSEMCPQISVTPHGATPSDSAAKSEASVALAEQGWGITHNYLNVWKSAHFLK